MNANGNGVLVDLVPGDSLDVDNPLLSVDLDHFALATGELSTLDTDFVILADGNGTAVVLLTEALIERSAHELSPDAKGTRIEIPLGDQREYCMQKGEDQNVVLLNTQDKGR